VRFPREEVDKLERDMGSYAYSGQYQQAPTPRSGGMFQRGDFEIVDACPPAAGGFGHGTSPHRAKAGQAAGLDRGLRMLMVKDVFYIEDVRAGRWSASDVETRLKNTASQDGSRHGAHAAGSGRRGQGRRRDQGEAAQGLSASS
jgi:hypothetical protein